MEVGLLCFGTDAGGFLLGARMTNARRPRSRRALRPTAGGSKKALLTFNEKELKAVLLEEYDWQGPMVRDLLRRLEKRKKE